MNLRDAAQELIELGPRGTLFRASWEARSRAGWVSKARRQSKPATFGKWTHRLQFEDPITLARHMRSRISDEALTALRARADDAIGGRIFAFGRWAADFGSPVDWHRSPVTGLRWAPHAPWTHALADERPGDVKYAWEVARFPHAYHLARAAAFFPDESERYAAELADQILNFIVQNPVGFGIHWASGQEVGLRLLSWLFALDVLLSRARAGHTIGDVVSLALWDGARHIEEHLDYARIAVYNNHLLSEAAALFGVGALLAEAPESPQWRHLGRQILDEEAERQVYEDGAYIQHSHNYHRVALQNYMWACIFARSMGDAPSPSWLRALERSLDFLYAHQNPGDGALPNYGSNDGALPSILSTCDFSDMRPVFQATSLLVRGERIYDSGPWDENSAWLLGIRALDAPLRLISRKSVSFPATGYHVLRGNDERSFCAFRCGSLRDRFSQIDMLHLDVWWRGQNVLVDPGSYQYNAAPQWHDHFLRTAAHNTVTLDGRDQMLHYRQFKVLYWTKAAPTAFGDRQAWAHCAGEHYGYRRHAGHCIHHREVLYVKDDLWIVADTITGTGQHHARLHWLGGAFEWVAPDEGNGMDLRTPSGIFVVRTYAQNGSRLRGDVVAGDERTPRGWLSRYYGEKVAVPSFAVECSGLLPLTTVSILSGSAFEASVEGARWRIDAPSLSCAFDVERGTICNPTISTD